MCAVGAITQTPYTQPNQRRIVPSLATPFCSDTTAIDGGATAASARTASKGRVALDREQDHVVVPPVDLVRPTHRPDLLDRLACRGRKPEPVALDRLQVAPSRDQLDLVTGAMHQGSDDTADGSCSVDHVAHPATLPRPAYCRRRPRVTPAVGAGRIAG